MVTGEQGNTEKYVLPAWCFAWGTLDWHKLYYGGAGTSVFKEVFKPLGYSTGVDLLRCFQDFWAQTFLSFHDSHDSEASIWNLNGVEETSLYNPAM